MFKKKSKAEKARAAAGDRLHAAQRRAGKAGNRAKGAAQGAGSQAYVTVRDAVGPTLAQGRDRVVAGFDHGVDAAAPKIHSALDAAAPRVDAARNAVIDTFLPRVHSAVDSLQARKDAVLMNTDPKVAVVTGQPKKKKRKGKVLLGFGIVSAIGAGVAWFLNSQQTKDDPWARPATPSQAPAAPAAGTVSAPGSLKVEPEATTENPVVAADTTPETADEATSSTDPRA